MRCRLFSFRKVPFTFIAAELQKAKEELNNHPLVKEYLEVYSRVRDIYLQINNILLNDFKGGKC